MSELSAAAEKKVLELKQAYIDSLPAKIQQLEMCWENIQASQFANSELENLRATCHKIAGSSGSFEFLEISNSAQKLEQQLESLLQRILPTEKFGRDIEVESEIEAGILDLKELLEQA